MEYPLKEYDIFDIIKYENLEKIKTPNTISQSEILCYGTCDLCSVRPIEKEKYYWADYFSKNTFYKGTKFPVSLQEVQIKFILSNTNTIKYMCYTLGILGDYHIIDNKILGITKNSYKVIRFLHKRNIITDQDKNLMLDKVDSMKKLSSDDIIDYYTNHLSYLNKLCVEKNINLLWAFNGTRTANEFFELHKEDIIKNNTHNGKYVGWVENKDSQVEGSMGPLTQIEMYKKFSNYMPYD